jgi:hypothetical protein
MNRYFYLIVFLISSHLKGNSQTIDRVSISSGAFSDNSMNYTIGETFNFSFANGGDVSFEMGSSGSNSFTGGIINQIENENCLEKQIVIFPNPAQNEFQISFNKNNNEGIQVQVFNISGQLIYSNTSYENSHKINIGNWSNGVYQVLLKNLTTNSEGTYPLIIN